MFTIICIVSSAEASAQDLATLIDQAQKGDPESQFILAYRYHDGDGVPTDYAIAFQWWMKAAQQGHVESQYNVAFLYERGEGVEQNYAEAFFWYKKAADQGMAAAQHVIGLMYIYGRVVMNGVVGVISHNDDMGQIHLEGYGLAIIPEVDEFEVIQ